MDPDILYQAPLAALAATVAFFILAFLLLYPVWRFLNREEELSQHWTEDEIMRAGLDRTHSGDGAGTVPEASEPGSGKTA